MLFQRISRARNCPVCKNTEVLRMKRVGLPVKVVCRVLNLRPHWCPNCDTFFLGPRQLHSVQGEPSFELPGSKGNTPGHPHATGLPH